MQLELTDALTKNESLFYTIAYRISFKNNHQLQDQNLAGGLKSKCNIMNSYIMYQHLPTTPPIVYQ